MMGNYDPLVFVFTSVKHLNYIFVGFFSPLPLVSFLLETRSKLPWANNVSSEHSVNIWGKNQYAKEATKIGSFNRTPSIDKVVFQEPV